MVLITGVAGFVGSSLAEEVLKRGFKVRGVDCFLDNYARVIKERNLKRLCSWDSFQFLEEDLLRMELKECLKGVEVVFHEAALPGVRESWGMNFKEYLDNNVFATQRLLEVAKNANLKKFIYASSSSVYGEAEILPTSEKVVPCPFSPYGVTKLAAENLCRLYWKNFGVPTVSLRYFTVYGPRQRPEMAFAKFIKIALQGGRIEIYGNGEQTRDFTFIDDVVEANILAMESGPKLDGEVFNIGGGSRVSVNEVLDLIGRSVGQELEVVYQESQKGDVLHTGAEIRKAKRFLGWQPRVTLQEGILRQVNYLKESDGC